MSTRRPAALAIDLALLVVPGCGWGFLAAASKWLFALRPEIFDGATLATARAAWTLPFFVAVALVQWRRERPQPDARDRWTALGLGVANGLGLYGIFSFATQWTSAAHAALTYGLAPALAAVGAALVLRTRVRKTQVLGLALGLGGVAVVATGRSASGSSLAGDALLVAWLGAYVVYAVLIGRIAGRFSSTLVSAVVGAISTALLLAAGLATESQRAIVHVADTPGIAAAFFGVVAFGATIVAPFGFTLAVRRRGVAFAVAIQYVSVVAGLAGSIAILHERWTLATPLAAALILAGLALAFVPDRRLPA